MILRTHCYVAAVVAQWLEHPQICKLKGRGFGSHWFFSRSILSVLYPYTSPLRKFRITDIPLKVPYWAAYCETSLMKPIWVQKDTLVWYSQAGAEVLTETGMEKIRNKNLETFGCTCPISGAKYSVNKRTLPSFLQRMQIQMVVVIFVWTTFSLQSGNYSLSFWLREARSLFL